MAFLARIGRYLFFLVAAVTLYTGWIFLGRYSSTRRWEHRREGARPDESAYAAKFAGTYGTGELKILQFYAREAEVTEGTPSVLCYGVLNARSVRIEPAVEGVAVSPNRCVEVAPEHDTRYTLIAEGNDGHTVSESFLLPVKADAAALPRVTSFEIVSHQPDYRGREVFLLSFSAQNPAEVDIDPPAFPTLHGSPSGRFYVAPDKTTTYTLTVTNKRGHKASRKLTVEVPPK